MQTNMFGSVPRTFLPQTSTNTSQNHSSNPPFGNARPRSLEHNHVSMGSGGGQPARAQSHRSSSSDAPQWPTWGVPSTVPLPTARLESPNHPFSTNEIAHSQPSEYHGHERQSGLPQTELIMSQEEWADWARSADIDISAFSTGPQPPAASQSPSHYATSSLETADEIEAAIAALLAPGPAMSSFDPLPSPANGTSQQVPNVAFPPSVGLSGSYRQVQGWMPFQPAHRPYEGTFDATYTVPDFWQPPPALRSSISTYPSASFPSIQQPPQPQPQLLSWPHPLQHSFRSTHAVPSPQPTQGSRVPGPSSRQNDRQAPYKKVPRPARPVHCKAAAQASGSASPSMGVTPSDTASSSSSARRQDTDLPGPTIWPKNRSCQCGYQFQYGLDDSPLESAYEHLDNAHHFVKPLSGRTVCGWPGCDKSYSTPRDFERHFKDEHLGVQYHCKNEDRCGHKPFGRPDKRGKHERRCQPDLAQASD